MYSAPRAKHTRLGGMASYTKNLATSLSCNCMVSVFADRFSNANENYCEKGVWVCRCWSRGLSYPFQIFRNVVRRADEIDVLHVQHEFFLFGGVFSAILVPFLLCLLRLLRKPVVVTLHNVISLNVVGGRFLRDNMVNGFPFVLKIGIFVLTRLIAFFSDVLIVHEEFFRGVLVSEYGIRARKVLVIPHGVEEPGGIIDSDRAKEVLGVGGKKVLLFFGYIAGYKGVESLIDAFDVLKGDEDFVLFIAGGEHPRLKGKREYQKHLQEIKAKAKEISDKIIFTGFVPEEMIPTYFSAADLVIFPYREVFSASGPMSLALFYGKPFLASENYRGIIRLEDMLFSEGDLPQKIISFLSNDRKARRRINSYCEYVRMTRNWENIAEETDRVYEKTARCILHKSES
jgi:glycosyltransferase involved in cell wall biosynthesis